jgi:hypothetical protein
MEQHTELRRILARRMRLPKNCFRSLRPGSVLTRLQMPPERRAIRSFILYTRMRLLTLLRLQFSLTCRETLCG